MQEVTAGADVVFTQTPVPNPLPEGITFTLPSTINIATVGVYEVTVYAVAQGADTTLALVLNGNEVLGARYADASSGKLTGQSLIVVGQGDAPASLHLRNVDPAQATTIDSGRLDNTVSVSILIKRIG